MLAPRLVIFTPSSLVGSSAGIVARASEALIEIERRGVPLVLSTHGTRAQLEYLRRKIGHAHPFITEGGGGLFIPDRYFSLRLQGATRLGRYLCVALGRSSKEAGEAVEYIARQAPADVVRYAEMTTREIASNAGMTESEAEASREREFSERFFFAGNTDSAARLFEKIAAEHGWQIRRSAPFWELYLGNDEGKALRYLMRLYREGLRSRIRSVAIGQSLEDVNLLAASDRAFIVPLSSGRLDEELLTRLPNAARIDVPGIPDWNETALKILSRF